MFANMARIVNLLIVRSLEFVYLVLSIGVYGLLARYETEICTPMLYEVNFINNKAHFTLLLIWTFLTASFYQFEDEEVR